MGGSWDQRFGETISVISESPLFLGKFVCNLEDNDTAIHHSGLWLGLVRLNEANNFNLFQAVPDPELSALWIPTNPINWCLSLHTKEPSPQDSTSAAAAVGNQTVDDTVTQLSTVGLAFGTGFFNDAGDIPGHPVNFQLSYSFFLSDVLGTVIWSARNLSIHISFGFDLSVPYDRLSISRM
jgi:hypothetical protein